MSDILKQIKAALGKLDPTNDDDWTDGGLPRIDRIQTLTGNDDLKRADISAASPGFTRVNAYTAPTDLSTVGPANDEEIVVVESAEASAQSIAELDPSVIAKRIPNPILLIEAAMAAMLASDQYRKNGELQAFMRHYSVAQGNIKAHQARLDKRYEAATKADS